MTNTKLQTQAQKVWALNGNEALAYGALHAGVAYFAHYPGSPVNGIEPVLKQLNTQHAAQITFNDALNEHVAACAAMGASMTGARTMLVMKHVGLNIAADPLNYVGYAGIKGGMLIVVGTDPGANSSTGEEDVHWYAKQFNLPLFGSGMCRKQPSNG
jgi:indolepyruvate ferredoxin oxidoreductase alpha subunit